MNKQCCSTFFKYPSAERRNGRDHNILFVGKENPLFDFIIGLQESQMLKEVNERLSCSRYSRIIPTLLHIFYLHLEFFFNFHLENIFNKFHFNLETRHRDRFFGRTTRKNFLRRQSSLAWKVCININIFIFQMKVWIFLFCFKYLKYLLFKMLLIVIAAPTHALFLVFKESLQYKV